MAISTKTLISAILAKPNYDKNDLMNKLDIFLANDRITTEDYTKYMEIINKN